MSYLSDRAIGRLREAVEAPDLAGTRYRLRGRLARGGMGTVYRVEDLELGREVALKVLSDPDPPGDLTERLRREAQHLARLEHPNIVPVHDAGTLPDGRAFYVMKLIRGRRLDEWAAEGPPRPALLRAFQKVCEAVAFAHAQGIVHRDLKPENVMIGAFGEAIVMDWGVAKSLRPGEDRAGVPAGGGHAAADPCAPAGRAAEGPRPTAPGAIVGTPAYMAPEQARGDVGRVGAWSDVYALGAVLHSLLTGRPPEPAAPEAGPAGTAREPSAALRRLQPAVPRPLASIAARAMAPSPDARYASARELADDIGRFLDGEPVLAHRDTPGERAARLLSRYQAFAWLVAAYLAMRVAILLFTRR